MKIKLLKVATVADLKSKIANNLVLYRNGNFDYIEADSSKYFESNLDIDTSIANKIQVSLPDTNEKENCLLMYKSMDMLTSYLARDERLWTYLTHSILLKYTRERWPIPDDDDRAMKHILSHFFCNGARGFERDNSASRLWWLAHLCDRVKGLSLERSLECLLHQTDVRANIIERPTLAQNPKLFSNVILLLNKSLKGDKKLFERDQFRKFMKNLNLEGGMILLSALSNDDVRKILSRCI